MIALLAFVFVGLFGPDGDEPERAERAYRSGDYTLALALYEAAIDGVESPAGEILYNMGNCAARSGRPAEAIFYYRRAALRMPDDPELRFNLGFVEKQLGVDPWQGDSLADAVIAWFDTRPRSLLLLSVVLLQAVGLLGIALARDRRVRRAVSIGLLAFGLVGAGIVVRLQWFPAPSVGVIVQHRLPVRVEPHSKVRAVMHLRAGEAVRVLERSDRWVRLAHARGEGWAVRSGVGIVE